MVALEALVHSYLGTVPWVGALWIVGYNCHPLDRHALHVLYSLEHPNVQF